MEKSILSINDESWKSPHLFDVGKGLTNSPTQIHDVLIKAKLNTKIVPTGRAGKPSD